MKPPTPHEMSAAELVGRRPSRRASVLEVGREGIEYLPGLYIRIARQRVRTVVPSVFDSTTDVVAEGFPRSGNTHLLAWLAVGNPQLVVASHRHSMAHVHVARRQGVPAIILLREPEDALSSEILRAAGRGLEVSPLTLMRRYHRFYTAALKVADDVIVSTFDVTTRATGAVVKALAASRPDLSVNTDLPDEQTVASEVEKINHQHAGGPNEMTVARPSDRRRALSRQVRAALRRRHSEDLRDLHELHDRVAEWSIHI